MSDEVMGRIITTYLREPLGSLEDLEKAVGENLKEFEVWFCSRGNEGLVRSETAILKSYLGWALLENQKKGHDDTPVGD